MWTVQSWYQKAFAQAKANPQIRDRAEHILHTYLAAMPGETRESVGRILTDYNNQRLAAVPNYRAYPELRGMPELIAASWKGARDGGEMDEAQAAINAGGLDYYHRVLSGGLAKQAAHCSVVYFHASDHGALLGVNLDTVPSEPYGPPGWPLMNEHLVGGGVSSGVYLDEESPERFPAPVFKLVSRYCRTAEEAVEMLTRYNLFWGPGNFLIADRDGHVAMIEKTACRIGVRWSHDGFGFVTAMTAEHPAMNAYLADRRTVSVAARGLPTPCADTRYWDAQDARRAIMNRLLADAKQNPTLESMRALMQYRGEDGVVCDNGDVLFPGDPPIEFTIKTDIICLSEARALWWTRDNDTGAPSWQNPRPEINYQDVLLWP
jgi:hypothetical protein